MYVSIHTYLILQVICRVCKNVFCCEKCCQKHEIKNHAIVVQNPEQLSDKNEASKPIYLFCSICAKQPLTLKVHMYEEMLEHINANHLPLHCIKCDKLYTKIADLKEFSKCSVTSTASKEQKCVLNQNSTNDDASKTSSTKTVTQITISTQTSPLREKDFDVVGHTPMSMLQLRWRTQSKVTQGEFISDSVSSIKNISNISNSSIRRSIGVGPQVRGKLVRSTSTPVTTEFAIAKPKDPTFNSSGEHVSSIYGSGCEVESPAIQNPTGGTPSKQTLDHKNRYRKSNRTKLLTVTPLRQVMSKSIQKAMVEHGLCIPNTGNIVTDVPLDLRLSPAVRRTQSDASDLNKRSSLLHKAQMHREHLSQKLTEQIVITKTKHLTSVESVANRNSEISVKSNASSTSNAQSSIDNASNTTNSVFQTCHSVEIITSTELSELNIEKNSCNADAEAVDLLNPLKDFPKAEEHNFAIITPITRTNKQKVLKKIIQFETPQIENQVDKDISTASNSEVFYTPTSTPLRKSSIRSNTKNSDGTEVYKEVIPRNLTENLTPQNKRPLIDDCAQIPTHNRIRSLTEDYDDDVFLQDNKNCEIDKNKEPSTNSTTGAGRLWSLMSSVIRLPNFSGKRQLDDDDDKNKHSLLKRCASIAGSLVRPKPLVDEEHLQSLKRKRTYTVDNQYQLEMGNSMQSPNADYSAVSSKRFRIYGRKPIDRMRANYL